MQFRSKYIYFLLNKLFASFKSITIQATYSAALILLRSGLYPFFDLQCPTELSRVLISGWPFFEALIAASIIGD